MRIPFYQFVLTYADPYKKDKVTQLANKIKQDSGFPKQASNYEELADYMEKTTLYLDNMGTFDALFETYSVKYEEMDNI